MGIVRGTSSRLITGSGIALHVLLLAAGHARADASVAAVIARAARDQVGVTTSYDPSYRRLDFPNGDVPIATGVCADVVVRALRGSGIDLQRELNADMRAHFGAYPANWGLSKPDRNIDHRRVPNLRRWFERRGWSLAVSQDPDDYRPGDIVSWKLADGRPHIGVVAARHSADGRRRLVVHNIAVGAREEDVLFAWTVTGRYRWPDADRSRPGA
ncbi:MAG TPA: DUF1287 domain-containing protein [Patescibacteria group bacterium]|nr:DUF1287 domain-containing protein [Patescibacteria group bacterium]